MMGNRVLAAVLVVAVAAAPVVAQPTAAKKQQAQELTKQGIAKMNAGDYQEAIDLYLKAYDAVPLPLLLTNIGTAYAKLGNPSEALRHFCLYLEKEPNGQSEA